MGEGPSSLLSPDSLKDCTSDVWGYISAKGVGSLHIWKGTINAEGFIEVFRAAYAPFFLSGTALYISVRQC